MGPLGRTAATVEGGIEATDGMATIMTGGVEGGTAMTVEVVGRMGATSEDSTIHHGAGVLRLEAIGHPARTSNRLTAAALLPEGQNHMHLRQKCNRLQNPRR